MGEVHGVGVDGAVGQLPLVELLVVVGAEEASQACVVPSCTFNVNVNSASV